MHDAYIQRKLRLGIALGLAVGVLGTQARSQDHEASIVRVPVSLRAVNADGNVAVGIGQAVGGDLRAAIWRRGTGIEFLPDLPNSASRNSASNGVSWDGTVVCGTSHTTSPRRAWKWSQATGIIELPGIGPPSGTQNDIAYAISGNGQTIVGQARVEGTGTNISPVLWDASGTHHLSSIPGGGQALVLSYSEEFVVGIRYLGTEVSTFRWSERGGVEFITPTQGTFLGLAASADASVIVGQWTRPEGTTAARWARDSGVVPIQGNGVPTTKASGVSVDGRTIAGDGVQGPWIWDQFHGVRLLRAVATEQLGVDPGALEAVTALSPDGRTVIGSGGPLLLSGYILRLRAPCQGDVDDGSGDGSRDGLVEVDDLTAFIQWMTTGDLRADLDDGSGTGRPDAAITLDDLLYFLEGYDAGC